MSRTATHETMRTLRVRRVIAALGFIALGAAGLVTSTAAPAAATTVTDEATFRAAWTNAAETQIDLAADINLTCGGGGGAIRNSATALTLDGHGHSITQTCAANGVLRQNGTGALTLQNVTITGGNAPASAASGGGVFATGDLSLTNATVTNNTAVDFGGGLFAQGTTTLTSSVVSNNTAGDGGGGMWIEAALTITNSTISSNHNTGTFGGGGISAAGPTTITNSTINGNDAGLSGGIGGGGMAVAGSTTITNSTITGNSAGSFGGGGIAISVTGTTTLVYATVVDNSTPATCAVATCGTNVTGSGAQSRLVSFGSVVALPQGGGFNCASLGGGTTSNGHNFSDDASCGFTAATDHQNAGNPNLGPLANNSGPTQTRLPQAGSPLINAIPAGSCQADGAAGITTDQRGVHRPQGAGCDIGSVEVGQVPQSKDDCKNGGWVNFVDDQGSPFRNQGQCVSFVRP